MEELNYSFFNPNSLSDSSRCGQSASYLSVQIIEFRMSVLRAFRCSARLSLLISSVLMGLTPGSPIAQRTGSVPLSRLRGDLRVELTRSPELLTIARRQGLTTLMQDGVLKCIQGLTDYTQVQAVAMR